MKNKKIAKIIAILLIIAAIFAGTFFRAPLHDFMAASLYKPAENVKNVEESLTLTEHGSFLFSASMPSLETPELFNDFCNSHDEKTTVLGCYVDSKIHVYNITNPELSGIVESTTAHELLHASYVRLSREERDILRPYLLEVYEKNQALLEKVMSAYSEEDYLEELYTRAGTQIADLPETLEKHYATIFKDQDKVVSYYNSYAATFDAISKEFDEVSSKIEELNTIIEAETNEYNVRSNAFISDVDSFNTCANTADCFNRNTFNARRSELLREQASLDQLYASLDSHIAEYNQLVARYNSNLLRSENLENAINSNAKVEGL